MDASSIITQVSRDDEQLNNYGSDRGKSSELHLLPIAIELERIKLPLCDAKIFYQCI